MRSCHGSGVERRSWPLIAAGILIWKYAPLPLTRWSGGFDLTVHIESPHPVRKIRLISVSRREAAEEAIDSQRRSDAKVFDDYKQKTFAPYNGHPVRLLIPTSGASNQSGYDYSFTWFKAIIVVGEYDDGRAFQLVVDLPDPSMTREITVRLP